MELLDLLEQRVGSLLDEVDSLREENRRLREDVATGQHKIEELSALQEELAREKQIREQALTRVDALLRRIQSSLGDGPEDNPFLSAPQPENNLPDSAAARTETSSDLSAGTTWSERP